MAAGERARGARRLFAPADARAPGRHRPLSARTRRSRSRACCSRQPTQWTRYGTSNPEDQREYQGDPLLGHHRGGSQGPPHRVRHRHGGRDVVGPAARQGLRERAGWADGARPDHEGAREVARVPAGQDQRLGAHEAHAAAGVLVRRHARQRPADRARAQARGRGARRGSHEIPVPGEEPEAAADEAESGGPAPDGGEDQA